MNKTTRYVAFPKNDEAATKATIGRIILLIDNTHTPYIVGIQRNAKMGDQFKITAAQNFTTTSFTSPEGQPIYSVDFGFEECCQHCRDGTGHHKIFSPHLHMMLESTVADGVESISPRICYKRAKDLVAVMEEMAFVSGCDNANMLRVAVNGWEYVVDGLKAAVPASGPLFDYKEICITPPTGHAFTIGWGDTKERENPIIPQKFTGPLFEEHEKIKSTLNALIENEQVIAENLNRISYMPEGT